MGSEHAGCWALCLGQSLRIPPPSLLEGRAGSTRHLSHQVLEESAGRTRHRKEDFQAGVPTVVPLSPGMASQLQARSQGPEDERTKGWGYRDTNTHHHSSHHTSSQVQTHPSRPPRARTGNPHSFLPESIPVPAPLLKTSTQHPAKSSDCCLPHTQPPTSLNTHSSALPPDTSSASLGSASPKSSCILHLAINPHSASLAELLVVPPCPAIIPAPSSALPALLRLRLCFGAPRTPFSICPDLK